MPLFLRPDAPPMWAVVLSHTDLLSQCLQFWSRVHLRLPRDPATDAADSSRHFPSTTTTTILLPSWYPTKVVVVSIRRPLLNLPQGAAAGANGRCRGGAELVAEVRVCYCCCCCRRFHRIVVVVRVVVDLDGGDGKNWFVDKSGICSDPLPTSRRTRTTTKGMRVRSASRWFVGLGPTRETEREAERGREKQRERRRFRLRVPIPLNRPYTDKRRLAI